MGLVRGTGKDSVGEHSAFAWRAVFKSAMPVSLSFFIRAPHYMHPHVI